MKKCYDVFYTNQARGLDIYSHNPDRWSRHDKLAVAKETATVIYYCNERDKEKVIKYLNRNAARANNK